MSVFSYKRGLPGPVAQVLGMRVRMHKKHNPTGFTTKGDGRTARKARAEADRSMKWRLKAKKKSP